MNEIERLTDRVLHVAKTFDPATRLPLVVLDSTALPAPQSDLYTALVSSILTRLPNSPYALLFFACGAPNKPSWSWVAKTYSMLERQTKKQVRKVYIVHESWWVRAVIEMLGGVISSKFKSKIIHVSSLSQLAQLIDITLINIHPLVYLHDLKVEDQITIPRHHNPIFGVSPNKNSFPTLWKDAISYLKVTAPVTRGVFRRTDYPELLYILRDAYDRSQLLDLDDYGTLLTASIVKLYLYELPTPVIPIKFIILPLRDNDPEYCRRVFQSLPTTSQLLLEDLLPILHSVANSARTQQTASSLGSHVGPSLIGLSGVTKESLAIASRFTRNLIELWPQVGTSRASSDSPLVDVSVPELVHSQRDSLSQGHPDLSQSPTRDISPTREIVLPPPPPPPRFSPSKGLFTNKNKSSPELRSTSDPISTSTQAAAAAAPPPPPPRFKKPVLQPSTVDNLPAGGPSKPPQSPLADQEVGDQQEENERDGKRLPPEPRKFGPRSRSVASTRRGKMVAELAKLYEDKSHSAHILVDLERKRKHS